MNANRLLEQYERIADAPDAIGRLRRFILDLAVRGKLVPQESRDEPAAELLTQIANEKARRIDAGDIRRPRDLDNGGQLLEPFAIPPTWCWVRLDTVGAIVGGGTPSSADADNFAEPGEGIPWLTPADLGAHSSLYISRGARDLSEKGARSSSATVMPKGTVLFTSRAPIGYVAIATNPISTNQGFKSIVPYVVDCCGFIAIAMRAFAPAIDARAPGTTFKEASGKIVAAVPFPLPPLAEQHRVVSKVEELMALCDQLEAVRAERETARDRLAAASLARFNSPNTDTFLNDARFVIEQLAVISRRPDQIRQLRQTILNLAVRGKLVPQAKEEPASELLKRIASERDELLMRGVIRRVKRLDQTILIDEPFGVPDTWVWSRIGDAVLFTQYGTSQKSHGTEEGVPVLTMGNIQDGLVIWSDSEKKIPATSADLPSLLLNTFDLLYNRTNSAELVGKTGLYLGEDGVRTFASYLIRLRPSMAWSNPRYLNMAMNAPGFRATQIIPLIKKQTGQANVNGTALKRMLIPIPPLAEQHRIVAKVDALMTLCDNLEASLITGEDIRDQLLDALLVEALAPPIQEVA